MSRVKGGTTTHARHKKVIKAAKSTTQVLETNSRASGFSWRTDDFDVDVAADRA